MSELPFKLCPPAILLASFALLPGCHRATEQDCERIVDRMVELELKDQGIADEKTVASRKVDARAKKHDTLIASCIGKRLPQSSMTCIDKAQTPSEITERCLR